MCFVKFSIGCAFSVSVFEKDRNFNTPKVFAVHFERETHVRAWKIHKMHRENIRFFEFCRKFGWKTCVRMGVWKILLATLLISSVESFLAWLTLVRSGSTEVSQTTGYSFLGFYLYVTEPKWSKNGISILGGGGDLANKHHPRLATYIFDARALKVVEKIEPTANPPIIKFPGNAFENLRTPQKN